MGSGEEICTFMVKIANLSTKFDPFSRYFNLISISCLGPTLLAYFLVHTCLGMGEVMQSKQALSPMILGTNLDVNRHFRMQKGW